MSQYSATEPRVSTGKTEVRDLSHVPQLGREQRDTVGRHEARLAHSTCCLHRDSELQGV